MKLSCKHCNIYVPIYLNVWRMWSTQQPAYIKYDAGLCPSTPSPSASPGLWSGNSIGRTTRTHKHKKRRTLAAVSIPESSALSCWQRGNHKTHPSSSCPRFDLPGTVLMGMGVCVLCGCCALKLWVFAGVCIICQEEVGIEGEMGSRSCFDCPI